MNRFLKNLGLFILPVFLLCASAEFALRSIPNDYSYKSNYLDRNSENIEVLFLGSSHAYRDINPIFINLNGFNAGYVSQTLDYDLKILEKYDGNWGHLKYIVLPISYFSLFYQLRTSTESWRVKNYNIYYGMTSSNKLTDYFEILSNNLEINLERITSYYVLGKPNITSSQLGWGASFNSGSQPDLLESGVSAATRHTYADDKYFNDNLTILRSIIYFADKRHITVFLYTPPAYHSYVEHLDKAQLERTLMAIKQIDHDSRNVFYVNFLTDDSFTAVDFLDADHLNEIGAEKFTKKIGELIYKNSQ